MKIISKCVRMIEKPKQTRAELITQRGAFKSFLGGTATFAGGFWLSEVLALVKHSLSHSIHEEKTFLMWLAIIAAFATTPALYNAYKVYSTTKLLRTSDSTADSTDQIAGQ